MFASKALIGSQNVHLSSPYVPRSGTLAPLVGRDMELRLIESSWLRRADSMPMCPLLLGEPGVGKNRLVYEAAARMGAELFILQGHEDLTPEDLAASARFAGGGTGLEYVASPLATAMLKGGICFIDEIGKLRPRALALLASALDERRYIDSILLGDRIHAEPGFRFIAATNTADVEGSMLPDYLRSRLTPVIHVREATAEEIAAIVGDQFHSLGERLSSLLATLWEAWNQKRAARGPSPRDAISVFSLATRLADHDGAAGIESGHVETAVAQLLGVDEPNAAASRENAVSGPRGSR